MVVGLRVAGGGMGREGCGWRKLEGVSCCKREVVTGVEEVGTP